MEGGTAFRCGAGSGAAAGARRDTAALLPGRTELGICFGGSWEGLERACERVCLPQDAGIVRNDESGFLGSLLMRRVGVCN